jgi:replicative DNA helicase
MLSNASYDSEGNMIMPKVLITIDHSLLFKKASYEKDKHDMLNNLGEALTLLKRQYSLSFIVLSQLNRNIDNPERSEEGKYGNYVLESDLFGADALLQHADTVIGINRPAKQKIRFYGPDRYVIEDDRVIVLHFLKCRNGDTRLSFFKAEFEKMKIVEMITPPQQEKRLSTK